MRDALPVQVLQRFKHLCYVLSHRDLTHRLRGCTKNALSKWFARLEDHDYVIRVLEYVVAIQNIFML